MTCSEVHAVDPGPCGLDADRVGGTPPRSPDAVGESLRKRSLSLSAGEPAEAACAVGARGVDEDAGLPWLVVHPLAQ